MKVKITTNEYSRECVPLKERKSFFSLLVVVLGLVFVVTSMQVGGIIGNSLSFRETIVAVLISSVILAVLGAFMGAIGAKTGLTFGLLTKYSFGEIGTWIPVVIVAVTTIGWFSIDAWLIGASTNSLFSSIPIVPIVILGGVGMTLTALFGIGWMNKLSNLAVPLIAIFACISIYIAFRDIGGIAGFNSIKAKETITFAQGISLGVGSYAVGAIMFTPDILRYAKSQKTAIIIMIISMVIGNSFVVLFGAIGAIATGEPDIANVLAMQNLLAPAFLVLVLNIWSTAQGCVYSGALSLSSKIKKVSREKIVIAFGVIGVILALVGFYNFFGNYINFLASLVPTLAGVLISDFFIKYKDGYPAVEGHTFVRLDYLGFAAWIAGIIVYFLPFGMPAVNAVIASFLVRSILSLIIKKE
jgi:cytosine permease